MQINVLGVKSSRSFLSNLLDLRALWRKYHMNTITDQKMKMILTIFINIYILDNQVARPKNLFGVI